MIAKIKSNVALTYDSRNQKSAIVEIEIAEWNLTNNNFVAVVNDYAVEMVEMPSFIPQGENQTNLVETRKLINTRNAIYSFAQVDALFSALGQDISTKQSFTTQLSNVIATALLIETQTNPVYGNDGNVFEIVVE